MPTLIEMRTLAKHFFKTAEQYNMKVQTCAEEVDLTEFGVENLPCMSEETAYFLTKKMKKWKKGQRDECECISTVDLGAYNCCSHGCRYCYANYDEKQIHLNMKKHDPESSLICGHLHEEDEIRIREN